MAKRQSPRLGNDKPWSPRMQAQRVRGMLAAVRRAVRAYFDDSGQCLIDRGANHFQGRENVHCCLAFFDGDPEDVAFGNLLLQVHPLDGGEFSVLGMIDLLTRHRSRILPATVKAMLEHIARELPTIRMPHKAFIGGNDNFPSMAAAVMVLGGELVGDRTSVEAGVDTLCSLRDMLARRGFFSEYNSPTYAAPTLHALDELANNARDPEAKRIARQGAYRMWLDVAAHWHPAASYQAGPHSRSYHLDSTAAASHFHHLMWSTFGDLVWPSPLDRYFGPGAQAAFEGDLHRLAYLQSSLPGYGSTLHRVGDEIAALAFGKKYPFRVKGTSEMGTFHYGEYRVNEHGAPLHVPGRCADFAADEVRLSTYMERDFAVGTTTRGFLSCGQSETFFELHRRAEGEVRTAFARYLVGPTDLRAESLAGLILNHGLAWAVQDDRRALALYHPNGYRHQGVDCLRLAILLPETAKPVDGVWIGERELPGGEGESPRPDWVILRDGPMWLAFYPLAPTDLGRKSLIRCRHESDLRVISFYNYDGPARDFGMHDLPRVANGFVFEAATTRQYGSATAFLKDLRKAELLDTTLMEVRSVRYLRAGRELLLSVDPLQQGIKAAAVNGAQIDGAPLEIDGFDLSRVPWLGKGVPHRDLGWAQRLAARPPFIGLEGVSGHCVK